MAVVTPTVGPGPRVGRKGGVSVSRTPTEEVSEVTNTTFHVRRPSSSTSRVRKVGLRRGLVGPRKVLITRSIRMATVRAVFPRTAGPSA